MKIKAIVTINMGLYMDIRPEIEIDTDNYIEAKRLIHELHLNFYGLLNGLPKREYDDINADLETKKSLGQTDWKLQKLYDRIRKGESIPFSEWDQLNESQQKFLHKAQLEFNQEQRLNKKDGKTM